MLDLAFSKLGLNRVESTHYAGNEASGRVMAKCGMKFEGKGRQEVKIKGIYHDVLHYGILKEEWLQNNTP
ncbi:MAG TPA: GNAT family N-acetyltransferase [Firmicutes bacterium]|nr:GNAT family N-acetyltransferase [Bacillota bacterium]